MNGTDHRSTTTDDKGAYVLNIKPATKYNITATYQGLQHTVWPVYLDNKTDTYNVNLTTTPRSTVEGTGYATSADPEHNLTYMGIYVIYLKSTRDNTTIFKNINSDGSYSLEVEPNVPYVMTGTVGMNSTPPIIQFYYHNYRPWLGTHPQITVGSNETVLIDYVVPVP
ncbi:hypothetical protein [Methanocella conradii]|uniref:hypothetical protein n=1 Tax=Methanocella conradii TaxID=1175444 RepID=UPI003D16DD6C